MPLTRSSSNQSLSREEIEKLTQILGEKERILKEREEALAAKQIEIERNRVDPSIMEQITQQLNTLNSLPDQIERLNYYVTELQQSNAPPQNPTSSYPPPRNDIDSPIRFKDAIDYSKI